MKHVHLSKINAIGEETELMKWYAFRNAKQAFMHALEMLICRRFMMKVKSRELKDAAVLIANA